VNQYVVPQPLRAGGSPDEKEGVLKNNIDEVGQRRTRLVLVPTAPSTPEGSPAPGTANQSDARTITVQPRFALSEALTKDMERLFVSQQALCRIMNTTAKTWRDMKGKQGVRGNTAEQTIIRFITLLRKTADGIDKPILEINELLVVPLDKRYGKFLSDVDFDSLMVRLDVGEDPPTASAE
jgi:hypothetical protein